MATDQDSTKTHFCRQISNRPRHFQERMLRRRRILGRLLLVIAALGPLTD